MKIDIGGGDHVPNGNATILKHYNAKIWLIEYSPLQILLKHQLCKHLSIGFRLDLSIFYKLFEYYFGLDACIEYCKFNLPWNK